MGDYVPNSIGLQTVAYVEVASVAALLFDFCITFDSEVRWTWGRKWGFVRIAFVISRYLPVASFAMSVYYAIESTRGGILNHGRFSAVYGSIHFVGAVAAEVLLVTRTYVFWGGNKRFLIAISVFSMVMNAAMLTISMLGVSESGDSVRGVFEEGRHASIIYALLAFYELVLVSVTLYKRSRFSRFESSPMVATLYRDGVVYLLCITVAAMANCVAIAVLPSTYTALLIGPQVVIHSVLASRILFNLRALQEPQDDITNITSDAVFEPFQYSVDYLELRGITNVRVATS